ncbi:LacI family transcriptional regulator [Clostridium gasigenes]|uniref:LacI family DNA-binding transcriptional regulator n=1 Tax=Clostridium gasigenes TaxID=94869 RepID=UPI001C0B9B3D|nr:LacI family DNA-binding transcriptional regulator [Clostridium gasigenes]MBU3089114.1 LacI family transcriptional regulator [Clostridium gasigenes]
MNIKDIAKMAEVAVGTVSRVVNNDPNVKDTTRKKILKIIKDNNYIPNNSARNLKKSNSNDIGVLVRGVFNPFFSEMIDVINKEIKKSGKSMILRQTDYSLKGEDEVREIISFEKERKLQGIIYLGCDIREVTEETFKGITSPIVLASVNTTYNTKVNNFSSVGIKQKDSAYMATKYLIDLGHKNIAIILGIESDSGLVYERFLGYKEALIENGLKFNENYIIYGQYNPKLAYKATEVFIKKYKEVDAIFSISDIMAIGAAKALSDNAFKVGKDISLVGFDGMDVTEFYIPAITTVVQPREEMAKISIDLLLKQIKKATPNEHIILETKLVKRESCVRK